MGKIVKDLSVKTGTYEKGGRTKGTYMKVGVIMTDEKGDQFILLDKTFNPAGIETNGSPRVLISVYDKPKETNRDLDNNKQFDDANDDEIPF